MSDSHERYFVGLHAGLSGDGIDCAIAAVGGSGRGMSVRQVASHQYVNDSEITHRLLSLREIIAGSSMTAVGGADHSRSRLAMMATMDRQLGKLFADAAARMLGAALIPPGRISAVGLMGLPVAIPDAEVGQSPTTMIELGRGEFVADRLGVPAVFQFASSDIIGGGQGGPICAWPEWIIFRDERLSRVTVNIGAIATITAIPASAVETDLMSFDVGPGTIAMDELAAKFFGRQFDADGVIAASGKVNPELLNELLSNPYFQAQPPKLANAGQWGAAYFWRVNAMAEKHGCHGADLMATLAETTARAIAKAICSLGEKPHEIILSGGGALNIHLAGRIRKLMSPCSTYTTQHYGLEIRSQRAVCAAILAAARIDDVPAGCPQVTGAESARRLGVVYKP